MNLAMLVHYACQNELSDQEILGLVLTSNQNVTVNEIHATKALLSRSSSIIKTLTNQKFIIDDLLEFVKNPCPDPDPDLP